MPVDKRTRERVFERDGGRCVACGTTYGLTLQHRANRGMGGGKNAECMSNYLTLCHHDNVQLEASAGFARKGRAYGWKCPRNQVTPPADVPVWFVFERAWFFLDSDGTRLRPMDWEQEVLTRAAQDQLQAVT